MVYSDLVRFRGRAQGVLDALLAKDGARCFCRRQHCFLFCRFKGGNIVLFLFHLFCYLLQYLGAVFCLVCSLVFYLLLACFWVACSSFDSIWYDLYAVSLYHCITTRMFT